MCLVIARVARRATTAGATCSAGAGYGLVMPSRSRSTLVPRPEEYVVDGVSVAVRRSDRRRRTVSARHEAGRLVVLLPSTLRPAEERRYVEDVARRLLRRARPHVGDAGLEARAAALSARYLGGAARPVSVRWSTRQHRRWGSCTPATGEIRISESARPLPQDVLDYVLLHELAHLLVPGHGPEFWALLSGFPALARARGFLDGVSFAQDRGLTPASTEEP